MIMRVIDFIGLGEESLIYLIYESSSIIWRGTRKDFIWELQAFFLLYFRPVKSFRIVSFAGGQVLALYI